MKRKRQKASGGIGLQPMPKPVVIARQVMRVALIVIHTGNELIRVLVPVIRAISGHKPRR